MPLQILSSAQFALAALQESDQEAFKRLLGTLLKPNVDVSAFKYGTISTDATDPEYAKTDISVDRGVANIEMWGYQDSQEIRYRRIGLDALTARFGGVIRVDLPTTKQELMAVFLTANGLYNRGHQIVDGEVVENGIITLEVDGEQLLLRGSGDFEVKPYQRQLVDVLTSSTLAGFRTTADFGWSFNDLMSNQLIAANQDLPYPLEAVWLRWDTAPEKVSGYRYDNTTIKVTAFGEGYYLGDFVVTYTRYDFGWANVGNQYLVDGPSQPTTQVILDSVSASTGLPLDLSDVLVENYDPIPSGEVQTLTVFFKEDNLRYTGELTVDYRAA